MSTQRKLQIGVMGSAADLQYEDTVADIAESLGRQLAKAGAIVVFGAEKDYDSLSTAAARGAKAEGGFTIGITYGKGLTVYEENVDAVIATGLERGGGRETVLVLSCDAVILVGGGSGTLTEAAIAYQAGVPIVAMKETGGWAEKLADTYLDDRKRFKVIGASSAQEAAAIALELGQKRYDEKL